MIATNRRLNRRCQDLERLLAEKDRRMIGMVNVLAEATARANDNSKHFRSMGSDYFYHHWRSCILCRLKRIAIPSWQTRINGRPIGFWRMLPRELKDWWHDWRNNEVPYHIRIRS